MLKQTCSWGLPRCTHYWHYYITLWLALIWKKKLFCWKGTCFSSLNMFKTSWICICLFVIKKFSQYLAEVLSALLKRYLSLLNSDLSFPVFGRSIDNVFTFFKLLSTCTGQSKLFENQNLLRNRKLKLPSSS